ncbi:MAG: hypothetical protein HW421_1005 [Ignavibacteria bacterium]|nr:hypothetical protein [Ignavibacteria bacterium]
MIFRFLKCFSIAFVFLFSYNDIPAQDSDIIDSTKKIHELLNEAKVKSKRKEIELTIRNVDISHFPEVSIIVEAYNTLGEPLDTLRSEGLTVMENDMEKKVISVRKISVKERVPVDFTFIIDKTGSMQKYIDQVKGYISSFTTNLVRRGIDYRIGLILFSDNVEKVYQPTDNVFNFLSWLSEVKAYGGGDEKENALDAIKTATDLNFRPVANKVGVLITDAPFHQEGEEGDGITYFTTDKIINLLNKKEFRLFSFVPPRLTSYKQISQKTRGTVYDIDYPFSTILDNFSNQLTNLFAITYISGEPVIPDSIKIALLNEKKMVLVRKIIPIIELGRKLIIENLLYETNKATLKDSILELEVLTDFMKAKQNVVIMVEGHTDDRGSHKINDNLSLMRAESVKKYLVRKGISERRIKTAGFGKRKPLADNNTEFGRSLNRRTEIVIVAK